MNEHLTDREQRMEAELSQRTLTLFIWGFLCGALAAYSSLMPLIMGMFIGVSLTYKKPELMNFLILRASATIHRITHYTRAQELHNE
jgi:hypothetical protein